MPNQLFLSHTESIKTHSAELKQAISETVTECDRFKNRGIGHLDPQNWEVIFDPDGDTVNFASQLQNIQPAAENLLENFYRIAPIVGAKKFDAFAQAVRDVSDKLQNMRGKIRAANSAKRNAERSVEEILSKKKQAEENAETISDIEAKVQELLSGVEEANETSQSTLAQISEISGGASNLKSQVEEYETQFQTFQKALDKRSSAFEKLNENIKALHDQQKNKAAKLPIPSDVRRICSRVQQMPDLQQHIVKDAQFWIKNWNKHRGLSTFPFFSCFYQRCP